MIRALFLIPFIAFLTQAPAQAWTMEVDDSQIESTIDLNLDQEGFLISEPNDVRRAHIVAIINKAKAGSTSQIMRVYVDGVQIRDSFGSLNWKVSTGREKKERSKNGSVYVTSTPAGYFRPTSLEKLHHSRKWDADMPNSVFFVGGIAIHGSPHVVKLGKRASGGCVRLHPRNAEKFFELVQNSPVTRVQGINRQGQNTRSSVFNHDVLIIVENRI